MAPTKEVHESTRAIDVPTAVPDTSAGATLSIGSAADAAGAPKAGPTRV